MKSKANWLKEGDSVLSSFSMNRIPLVHAVIAFILFILFIYFLEQMALYKVYFVTTQCLTEMLISIKVIVDIQGILKIKALVQF